MLGRLDERFQNIAGALARLEAVIVTRADLAATRNALELKLTSQERRIEQLEKLVKAVIGFVFLAVGGAIVAKIGL